jgi:hypothetical protein
MVKKMLARIQVKVVSDVTLSVVMSTARSELLLPSQEPFPRDNGTTDYIGGSNVPSLYVFMNNSKQK